MRTRYRSSILVVAFVLTAVTFAASAPAAPPPAAKATPAWTPEPEDPHTWQRDPFRKIEGPKALNRVPGALGTAHDLALQGIMKINKHYYAIINGRTVKRGNRIDGWTITGISRYRVTVSRDKEQQTFDIYQGRINRGTK